MITGQQQANRKRILHPVLSCLFFLLLFAPVSAQIRFPNGNDLYLETNNNLLYLETRILFNTGKYKASDYRWEKISDSLEPKWLVTACFNGDCRNDLLQSGQFITDYGLNDTTCFIAFHVETHDLNGAIRIRYRIYNTKEPKDSGTLSYYIRYRNSAGFRTSIPESPGIFHDTRENCLRVSQPVNGPYTLELWDVTGHCLEIWDNESGKNNSAFLLPDLAHGIYLVRLRSGNTHHSVRIILP